MRNVISFPCTGTAPIQITSFKCGIQHRLFYCSATSLPHLIFGKQRFSKATCSTRQYIVLPMVVFEAYRKDL